MTMTVVGCCVQPIGKLRNGAKEEKVVRTPYYIHSEVFDTHRTTSSSIGEPKGKKILRIHSESMSSPAMK